MKRIIALVLAGIMVYSLPVLAATSPSSSSVSKKEEKEASSPAAAVTATVSESSSVPASVEEAAAANNQSVAEYANNAVSSLPGIANVTPMAPDVVMINGAASRAIRLAKPNNAVVSTAKAHAGNLGGTLMNVLVIKSGARFQTAQINMLSMGVRAGQDIKVYQLIGGQPVELEVLEIREDHVVFNITEPGTIMFVLF
ncbi:MAG: hypothetical protein NC400_07990 [Clostridium sp.]|nr:hypothetical protein [Clostridium sp.]